MNQEQRIREIFRMITHLEVEIVDTNPSYYNENRWSNAVADIFFQCSRGPKTVEHMEKVINLMDTNDCYINETDDNQDKYTKFWNLYNEVLEIDSLTFLNEKFENCRIEKSLNNYVLLKEYQVEKMNYFYKIVKVQDKKWEKYEVCFSDLPYTDESISLFKRLSK